MKEEIKTNKGRKFIVLQEILIFGVLYITACIIKPELKDIGTFAMTVVGAGVGYMGANAVKAMKK